MTWASDFCKRGGPLERRIHKTPSSTKPTLIVYGEKKMNERKKHREEGGEASYSNRGQRQEGRRPRGKK